MRRKATEGAEFSVLPAIEVSATRTHFGCGSIALSSPWLILIRFDGVAHHIRVVDVEHDTLFVRRDFQDVGGMCPDHRARALVGGDSPPTSEPPTRGTHL